MNTSSNLQERAKDALEVLKRLEVILRSDGGESWIGGILELEDMLSQPDRITKFAQAQRTYRQMIESKSGISGFYVWRDDYNERFKLNQELKALKKRLWETLHCG